MEMNRFEEIVKMSMKELKKHLFDELKKYYPEVISADGFVYAKGDGIGLLAHMDKTLTVSSKYKKGSKYVGSYKRQPITEIVKEIKDNKTVISSPQGIGGDDRCGVAIILDILEKTKHRPTIIFTEDEEIGCLGAKKFARSTYIADLKKLKYLVQLDRRGNNDSVYYYNDNREFIDYIVKTISYPEKHGSYTDICDIAPKANISAVNLSVGYYDEHTDYETVVWEEVWNTKNAVIKLLDDIVNAKEFDYVEKTYSYSYGGYNYGSYGYWNYDYDDDDDDYYYGTNSWWNKKKKKTGSGQTKTRYANNWHKLYIELYELGEGGNPKSFEVEAPTLTVGFGKFFMQFPQYRYLDIARYQWENETPVYPNSDVDVPTTITIPVKDDDTNFTVFKKVFPNTKQCTEEWLKERYLKKKPLAIKTSEIEY